MEAFSFLSTLVHGAGPKCTHVQLYDIQICVFMLQWSNGSYDCTKHTCAKRG